MNIYLALVCHNGMLNIISHHSAHECDFESIDEKLQIHRETHLHRYSHHSERITVHKILYIT